MKLPEMKHIERGMLLSLRTGRVGRVLDKKTKQNKVTLLADDAVVDVTYEELEERIEEHALFQIHPMLSKTAKKKDLETLLASPEWGAEPKFDGERQILTYIPGGLFPDEFPRDDFHMEIDGGKVMEFRATTRVVGTNSGVLGVNSFKLKHLARVPVPQDGPTLLDAELLHLHGDSIEERFRSLRSIMGSSDDKANKRQKEIGTVYAVVFDALWLNGEDLRHLPFSERRAKLEAWYKASVEGTDAENNVELSRLVTGETEKSELLDWLLENGWEGMMLKRLDAPYTDTSVADRRSPDILKVKPFSEDDVIVTGFLYGEGEYNQHRISRVTFAQFVAPEHMMREMRYVPATQTLAWEGLATIPNSDMALVDMGRTSAISYKQDEAFRADPDSFIGKIMEVRFKDRWPNTGKMRHPSFRRMRDDKKPLDCVYKREET